MATWPLNIEPIVNVLAIDRLLGANDYKRVLVKMITNVFSIDRVSGTDNYYRVLNRPRANAC